MNIFKIIVEGTFHYNFGKKFKLEKINTAIFQKWKNPNAYIPNASEKAAKICTDSYLPPKTVTAVRINSIYEKVAAKKQTRRTFAANIGGMGRIVKTAVSSFNIVAFRFGFLSIYR